MRCALTIAGSDPGGGAGIQADLKTFAAYRLYGASVITAVTAQNTLGVQGSYPLPPEVVEAQLSALLEDLHPAVIKIGMLGSAGIVRTVSRLLDRCPEIPVVLDPVMLSTSGHPLLDGEGITSMKQKLFPRAAVITPNLPEAQALTGLPLPDLHAAEQAAGQLYNAYGCGVLVKGGHSTGAPVDVLYDGSLHRFPGRRIPGRDVHGTGCTLSSAIAAGLARGQTLPEAVQAAKAYLSCAMEHAFPVGGGAPVLDHFLWNKQPGR